MNITKIAINNTPIINTEAKEIKAIKNNNDETKIAGKEVLNNPLETVGRSQVNFRGGLSAEELNLIASTVERYKLDKEEIQIVKKALEQTKIECDIPDLRKMRHMCCNEIDFGLDAGLVFLNNISKIKPNADFDKLGRFFVSAF